MNTTTNTSWATMTMMSDVAHAIVELYEGKGSEHYAEALSQAEHARQVGALAMAAGAGDETIVAALLHDIGHLLIGDYEFQEHNRNTDFHHQNVGARFLSRWFGQAVTEPIRLHVDAKRYLCAVEPDYRATLSAASIHSLELQGGPMADREAEMFEARPFAEEAIAVRRWDDRGKVPGSPVPPFRAFAPLIVEVLG